MNELHLYSRAEKIVFQLQEEWLPPHAAGVTVASRTLQTRIRGMGIAPENCPLSAELCGRHPPRKRFTSPRKTWHPDGCTGGSALYPFFEFDQERLHLIFAEIFRQVPDIRFLVVGKGRNGEEKQLVETAKTAGFAPALLMAGWVEPSEIPDYLAAGDVALYPFDDTLINLAKCPAKLTELLRAGLPVVADNVGQLAEYIKPGVSGILCSPGNWREMAVQAIKLLRNPVKRSALG